MVARVKRGSYLHECVSRKDVGQLIAIHALHFFSVDSLHDGIQHRRHFPYLRPPTVVPFEENECRCIPAQLGERRPIDNGLSIAARAKPPPLQQ